MEGSRLLDKLQSQYPLAHGGRQGNQGQSCKGPDASRSSREIRRRAISRHSGGQSWQTGSTRERAPLRPQSRNPKDNFANLIGPPIKQAASRASGSLRVLSTEQWAQLSIHPPPDSRNDVRHRFHIRLRGMKVHDAGAQHVAAADYGVGEKCFTSALQPIDQLAVERIEMK